MLAVVSAVSGQQQVFVRGTWKPDGLKLFIEILDGLISLSEEEGIFEDIEAVLGVLDGEDESGDGEDDDEGSDEGSDQD